jgi:hypothetical protein
MKAYEGRKRNVKVVNGTIRAVMDYYGMVQSFRYSRLNINIEIR